MPPDQLGKDLSAVVRRARGEPGPRVFLTGAGISAESGIPTFRGVDGYWVVGSEHYRPEELATYHAFRAMPDEVWGWYLYRRSMCAAATPNAAHLALADLERAITDDFLLITQNVDGLHPRAGNSLDRTWQIHGNLDFNRCAGDCTPDLLPAPEELLGWEKGRAVTATERQLLTCQRCGDWLRPHVLWFDECYDEDRYRYESSMVAAESCSVLVIVGTSGATSLPMQVASAVAAREIPFIVVDPTPSPFSEMAIANPNGCFIQASAGESVPAIARALTTTN